MFAITIETLEGETLTLVYDDEELRDMYHRLLADDISNNTTPRNYLKSTTETIGELSLNEAVENFSHMVKHNYKKEPPKKTTKKKTK